MLLNNCYLCGRTPATNPLDLPKTFTNHSAARCPQSDKLCDRCHKVIAGDWQIVWYFNAQKIHPKTKQQGLWSKIFTRNCSWLFQYQHLISPTISLQEEEHFSLDAEGKPKKPEFLKVASNLATREQIRGWLLNPPEPPFTIAIAQSGQKHILPFAQEGLDREHFPVQFETESIWINRSKFSQMLSQYQTLVELGFSKTEITSGDYRSDRLVAAIADPRFTPTEEAVARYRGSQLIQLAEHVA